MLPNNPLLSNPILSQKGSGAAPGGQAVTGDPNKVVGYINGKGYNYGGDFVPGAVDPTAANQQYIDQAKQQNAQLQSLLASLRPVSPANVDYKAINAQARQQAEESVNPKYTQQLNDMLAREAVKRGRAQQDYNLGVQNIQEQLQQTQAGNEQQRGRTAEDVATNTGIINQAADQFQTQTGQQFDEQRLQQAAQLASSGLTTSGVGQQQIQQAVNQQNVSEQQKEQDFQHQRAAQAILKARTFEDLAQSDVLAGKQAEKGKASTKLNLDRLIEDIGYEQSQAQQDIAEKRLADVAQQTQGYSKIGFNNYLQSIRDPRIRAATAQAYGAIF